MMVVALLCLAAAILTAALGAWALTRPPSPDYAAQVLRGVAPIQLSAAVMLAVGAAVGVAAAAPTATVVLAVCVTGAAATVAAGCWQSAKAVSRAGARAVQADGCGGACAACTLSCR